MLQSIQLKTCRFDFDHSRGYCQTVFPDGKFVPAVPHDTDEYRATAAELGYGAHTIQMCFDHELIHTLLAEAGGLDYSPVLRHVADEENSDLSERESGEEEAHVMAFQKILNQARCRH
jgi:hypothetical protein